MKTSHHFICSICALTLPLMSSVQAGDTIPADFSIPTIFVGLKDKAQVGPTQKQRVEHQLKIKPKSAPHDSSKSSKKKVHSKKQIWNWFKRH